MNSFLPVIRSPAVRPVGAGKATAQKIEETYSTGCFGTAYDGCCQLTVLLASEGAGWVDG